MTRLEDEPIFHIMTGSNIAGFISEGSLSGGAVSGANSKVDRERRSGDVVCGVYHSRVYF